jgi:hypothetical protein
MKSKKGCYYRSMGGPWKNSKGKRRSLWKAALKRAERKFRRTGTNLQKKDHDSITIETVGFGWPL